MSKMDVMQSASSRISAGQLAGAAHGPMAWFKAKLAHLRRCYQNRAAMAALRSLDDRMLKDIGLERSALMQPGCLADANLRDGDARRQSASLLR